MLFVLAACTTDNKNDQSIAEISSTVEQTYLIASTEVNDTAIYNSDNGGADIEEEKYDNENGRLINETNKTIPYLNLLIHDGLSTKSRIHDG